MFAREGHNNISKKITYIFKIKDTHNFEFYNKPASFKFFAFCFGQFVENFIRLLTLFF